jgi:hypothetical protein
MYRRVGIRTHYYCTLEPMFSINQSLNPRQPSLLLNVVTSCVSEDQWRLLGGGRLIIMAEIESMEWHQTHGNHVFHVFDTIPLILLQPLRACSPQLRCHQPPVLRIHI